MYFAGLEKNDGKGEYPFTDDCVRIEGGMQTTGVPLRPGEETAGSQNGNHVFSQLGMQGAV